MTKLKIFCPSFEEKLSVVEENILIFGKTNIDIINNNNTFKNFKQDEFLDVIEYSDLKDCDFIYYPDKIFPSTNIDELIKLSENYNKKILLFYNDDSDYIFNFKNSIIFRTSINKSKKPKNYYSLPAFCNDLKDDCDFFYRKKNELPTIGFCGALTHPLRKKIIDTINNSNLPTNFIIRNNFWGGNIWGEQVRKEYIENTLNSDIILCLRGAGNFSYRFYETICLGKIPLVIDTDLDFPFGGFISYENNILKTDVSNVDNLDKLIIDFWEKIDDYDSFQKKQIDFWKNNLSPIGFIKNLNLFKNEINNLLHKNT
jgi:hypothetical protein